MAWTEKFSTEYLREHFTFHPVDIVNGLATEKQELLDEWQPVPLVPEVEEEMPHGFQRHFTGIPGKRITIDNKEYINLSTQNFLGMIGNKEVEKSAIATVQKHGVGSCGPRGFYGTVDKHLELEEKLAQFMRCEEAILYSYGFSTIASAIPAYAKRGDVLFVDEGVCFPIQKGLEASRSSVRYFKHNDMADLERLLEEQAIEDQKNPRKAKVTRRFLIVEGIYMNYGDICPLPKLIELKYKYKVRIFLEESVSFGVLGETGRGVTEHFNCEVEDVDMICSNIEFAIGSTGGFCCGRSFVIDHQRLSGLGYCFSASLPPLLAQGAITALNIMQHETAMFLELQNKIKYLHQFLKSLKGLSAISEPYSPIQHLVLSQSAPTLEEERKVLDRIVEVCMAQGVATVQARYIDKFELKAVRPSIRLSVNVNLSKLDLKAAADALELACQEVLN
ncbi:serine palmitoyltransferase 1-like isoform X2 [Watersipora subatra]|uniref:serine palmitoyltransferase 1-like isoform X2 n=1 Tax=Watersipora subatra TaxID=2589382 RepID=UPI00355AF5A2